MTTVPATGEVVADRSLVGLDLASAYTAVVDAWLGEVIDEVSGLPGFALAAVGGYGRGDLSPGSDLDLLLITQFEGSAAGVAERIWYPIWDSGLKLGHAVRTIDEALELASTDLDTATSLLEMRCLGGSNQLVEELSRRALAQWRALRDPLLDALAARTRERHATSGELAFLLEPDLKLAQGGLRDIHSLRWIDLADPELIEESERQELARPHHVLLSARIELHRATGRSSNDLLLQEQDEVANRLGYGDADELMADVAAAGRTVSWIVDAVLHRVHLRSRRRWLRKTRSVGHGIEIVDNTLRLLPDAPVHDPLMPLRVALEAVRHDAFIERDALDRIAAEDAALPEPWPDEARDLFVDLLLTGHEMIRVVEALDQVGIVTRLIPEWEPNRNRPQRNAYHRFTVDRHLLEAAAEAAELADRVERPDLLVLGGLFHDIGKGYPGDHSEVGVGLVNTIATRMGYPPADVEVLEALVRHHLLLPDIASRRDLEDPRTIQTVADAVGSVGTVELLAALTEADSIATSKAAWGGWKAELVRDLAERTVAHLRGEHEPVAAAPFPSAELVETALAGRSMVRVEGTTITVVTPDRPGVFSRVAGALALHGIDILDANLTTADQMVIDQIRVEGGVALHERPDAVASDIDRALRRELAITARLLRRAKSYRFQRVSSARPVSPGVVIDNDISSNATVLEVRGPDSIGFLYRVTRAFVELDLDIVRAKVQTLGSDVIDTFYVRGPNGTKVTDPDYLAEIELAVLSAIGADA